MKKTTLLLSIILSLFTGCDSNPSEQLHQRALSQDEKLYNECHVYDLSCVKAYESVTLYDSYAYFDENENVYKLNINAWIHQDKEFTPSFTLFKNSFEAIIGEGNSNSTIFVNRSLPFFTYSKSDKKLLIQLGSKQYSVKASDDSGIINDEISLSKEEVESLKNEDGVINYSLILDKSDSRYFEAKVFVPSRTKTAIISDIDDTIKVTEVYKGIQYLLINTFLKDAQVTNNTQALFQKLLQQYQGLSVHYVSGSPYQLYPTLKPFIKTNYIEGSFHLKNLRFNPLSPNLYSFIEPNSTYIHKMKTITTLIENFPQKKFILIGDSGEKDIEVYGDILAKYPQSIETIYIRNVTNERLDNTRMKNAFSSYATKVIFIEI